MEGGEVTRSIAVTPQGGVISPLLSNIYLHVLDTMWQRDGAQYGTLARYADDFVVICTTRAACEQAEKRVRVILTRLGREDEDGEGSSMAKKASTSSVAICTSD